MIAFEDVSVVYDGADRPALQGVDLRIPEGELALLVGPSGVGKSTLLGAVSGLVPHFTGGTLRGRVTVGGRDTRLHPPRELADLVGTVGQDPLSHFVTDTVEDELAYGMESLGLPADTMRRRVEETLDLLGLADLRDRPIASLSGGQQQRVAIGSVLTPHPRVLVLDEPTSALDPAAAEEVLAVLQRLVHDLGTTVLLAEHRLERVVQYADQVIVLPTPGTPPTTGTPADMMAVSPVYPPVVSLGRLAGWTPLPLSIRDARRAAAPLRERLSGLHPVTPGPATASGVAQGAAVSADPQPAGSRAAGAARVGAGEPQPSTPDATTANTPAHATARAGEPQPNATTRLRALFRRRKTTPPTTAESTPTTAETTALAVRRNRTEVLRNINLTLTEGETIALMGRNGAGKSTLLRTLVGLHEPTAGSVTLNGRITPAETAPRDLLRHAGLVPQDPRDLLYADTVAAECDAADADAGAPEGTCRALVTDLLPDVADGTHPRDLSEGQRLALALAVILTARPRLLLLDEPTRGLDYAAKHRLAKALRTLAAQGHTIVLATHDVELAAELAHRVIILAEGEIVADGPMAEVVVSSPAFAPQVTKILGDGPWLTVPQIRRALEAAA
ncbi:ATP-binding cassette domain-containing protein [Streptomyces sp. NPDC051940]|uniref:ABC transporter ATP-binding protein n=1 Tax=Streptomyces sp. NPDC051940 TaxID=3155675 RepID=UPI003437A132